MAAAAGTGTGTGSGDTGIAERERQHQPGLLARHSCAVSRRMQDDLPERAFPMTGWVLAKEMNFVRVERNREGSSE